MVAAQSYTIKIPQFEGPFDLLLFFVERDELDIYNIPIATITDDFLSYIKTMEHLNIDLASEFIVMAATLMQIKARMLLPRKELNEDGEEMDPREELMQKLIEYKRYKETLPEFHELEALRSKQHQRQNMKIELGDLMKRAVDDSEMETLSLFKLMNVFEGLMKKQEDRVREKKKAVIFRFNYNIRDEREKIFTSLSKHGKLGFTKIFTRCKDRIHAIVRFLAVLDMVNEHQLELVQGEGNNNFWLRPSSN